MAKHTPGPWNMVGHCTDGAPVVQPLAPKVNGNKITATCFGTVAEANARLIAAAPDLLAACIDALEVEEQMAQCPDSDLAARLRAAIAKATD